jgi:alanyl-tRNA synthetase
VALSKVDELVAGAISVGTLSLVTGQFREVSPESARSVGDRIKQKLSCVAIVLFVVNSGPAQVIAMADKCAVDLGVDCGKIVKGVAGELGGGGGGRRDLAQAGIRDISGVEAVIRKMPHVIDLMAGSAN